jgi:NAD(P)H-hydrate epimerase
LVDWLEKELRPTVADADALNLLVHHQGLLGAMNGPRLLTPHPGEFSRLFPEVGELMTRRQRAEQVVAAYPNLTLLYTGNPGMASGGMGDFLTGVCTGLLAQGYDTYVAASMGAWLCGRAADQLIATGAQTCETLRASHLSQALPQAWKDLSR